MEFPSELIKNAVNAISNLPGIGKRSALRLVMHILRNKNIAYEISKSIKILVEETTYCKQCHNISKKKICNIYSNVERNNKKICVVEDVRDIIAIENTLQYNGHYHSLGGLISPIDGISPSDLNIKSLVDRISSNLNCEIIFALSASMEGETTSYYLYKQLKELTKNITTISKGVAVGNEIEYTDQVTLGRAIVNRYSFEKTVQ